MQPLDFEEANFTFKKPSSMTDAECGQLRVHKGESGGYPVIISKWQPSEEELENIKNGGAIYLSIWGTGMPPVSVYATNPFVIQETIIK